MCSSDLDDEDIPSLSTTSPIEYVAVQDNSNEVRLGPLTRSRTMLIEQQVNSFLVDCDNLIHENFILHKSMHLCMIWFVGNTSANGEKHQDMEGSNLEHDENKCTSIAIMKTLDDDTFTSVET